MLCSCVGIFDVLDGASRYLGSLAQPVRTVQSKTFHRQQKTEVSWFERLGIELNIGETVECFYSQ